MVKTLAARCMPAAQNKRKGNVGMHAHLYTSDFFFVRSFCMKIELDFIRRNFVLNKNA